MLTVHQKHILQQVSARLHAEVFHDRVFVKRPGARGHMQEVCGASKEPGMVL